MMCEHKSIARSQYMYKFKNTRLFVDIVGLFSDIFCNKTNLNIRILQYSIVKVEKHATSPVVVIIWYRRKQLFTTILILDTALIKGNGLYVRAVDVYNFYFLMASWPLIRDQCLLLIGMHNKESQKELALNQTIYT